MRLWEPVYLDEAGREELHRAWNNRAYMPLLSKWSENDRWRTLIQHRIVNLSAMTFECIIEPFRGKE